MSSICVFCGSRDGANPAFPAAADALGAGLANAGHRLVYGAGDVGLMGRVARSAQANGGATFGVIPVHLFDREVGKRDLSTFVVTENMHERKKVMFMNCDEIVLLPGGAGSLDEFFEVLTWAQLGLHKKPIHILNIESYWNPLLGLLDNVVENGFADASIREFIQTHNDVDALLAQLQ